jgi:hypothetical protein
VTTNLNLVALHFVHHIDFLVIAEKHLRGGLQFSLAGSTISTYPLHTIMALTKVSPASTIEPAFCAMAGAANAMERSVYGSIEELCQK